MDDSVIICENACELIGVGKLQPTKTRKSRRIRRKLQDSPKQKYYESPLTQDSSLTKVSTPKNQSKRIIQQKKKIKLCNTSGKHEDGSTVPAVNVIVLSDTETENDDVSSNITTGQKRKKRSLSKPASSTHVTSGSKSPKNLHTSNNFTNEQTSKSSKQSQDDITVVWSSVQTTQDIPQSVQMVQDNVPPLVKPVQNNEQRSVTTVRDIAPFSMQTIYNNKVLSQQIEKDNMPLFIIDTQPSNENLNVLLENHSNIKNSTKESKKNEKKKTLKKKKAVCAKTQKNNNKQKCNVLIENEKQLIVNNKNSTLPPGRLREIIVDGCNVATTFDKLFSEDRIKLVIDYFKSRGHSVTVFLPQHKRSYCRPFLEKLFKEGTLVFTPSRRIEGRNITPYDDRFILEYATKCDGIIISSDQFRDLYQEKPEWRYTIINRLLQPTFVGNCVLFPQDPLGRNGPTLDQFLRHVT